MTPATKSADAALQAVVIGGGPAGLVAALALAQGNVPAVLVAKRAASLEQNSGPDHAAPIDNRTTALLANSVATLAELGVWQLCRGDAAPLRALRIADDTRRLWRAPEVRFEAAEIGLEAFGWNIANEHLVAALWKCVDGAPSLKHVEAEAEAIDIDGSGVTVRAAGRHLRCQLVIGADGRNSMCRAAAGISVTTRTLPQTALTFMLSHSRPHHDISTEFHSEHGPFTLVPLPGLRSSLVCVVAPAEADHLATLHGERLDREIEQRSHSVLGKVHVAAGHGVFPLGITTANRQAANRVALVGEAAHLLPPIGAQGLNLGLRDGVALANLAADIYRRHGDIGAPGTLAEYERRRRSDITIRTLAVDLLNRSLLSDFLPIQGLRGLGLYALALIGPLRRALMREGISPSSAVAD